VPKQNRTNIKKASKIITETIFEASNQQSPEEKGKKEEEDEVKTTHEISNDDLKKSTS
jgi:hypothetical protein